VRQAKNLQVNQPKGRLEIQPCYQLVNQPYYLRVNFARLFRDKEGHMGKNPVAVGNFLNKIFQFGI
jgi:hypothetical protein